MSSFTKSMKLPWGGQKVSTMQGKENSAYVHSPSVKKMFEAKPTQSKAQSTGLAVRNTNNMAEHSSQLRRNTTFTKSFRDAVGTIRQKLRKSTRQRKRLRENGNGSPATPGFHRVKSKQEKRTPRTKGPHREVKMYSPFGVETPRSFGPVRLKDRPRWHDVETPTRLRKEVEDLTSNMQALISLTPRTLMTRAQSRKLLSQSPVTSSGGSMKSTKSENQALPPPEKKAQVRRRITTTEL